MQFPTQHLLTNFLVTPRRPVSTCYDTKRAQFSGGRVQGLNEELASRDRALRRAALERTIREAALVTAQRDLEDAEDATQEALHISNAERTQWNDQMRRLRNQEVRNLCLTDLPLPEHATRRQQFTRIVHFWHRLGSLRCDWAP